MKPKLRSFLFLATSSLLTISYTHADTLYWDSDALTTAARLDGLGAWTGANQWWTGAANTNWVSGSDAVFGYSGAGGAVSLTGTTTIGSLAFNPFTGTYTLGTTGAGNTITLNNGITMYSGGAVTFNSPLILGAAQTWTNNGNGLLSVKAMDLNGKALTVGGIGSTTFDGATTNIISGAGGIVKNGPGSLFLDGGQAITHTFTGGITVNGGFVFFQNGTNVTGRGNVTLNGGYLEGRFNSPATFAGGLGTGATAIQILGGTSGFSGQGATGSAFTIGAATDVLKWGATGVNGATGFFNPTVLILGGTGVNTNGKGSLANSLDLNGANRTFTSLSGNWTGGAGDGFTLTRAIVNTAGTSAGIIRTGVGNIILAAANTYDGATTLNGGTMTLSGSGTIASTSALNLGGGTLRLVNTAQVNRFADVAVSATAGGGVTYENTAGAVNYTESLGALTLTKGQVNVLLSNDHNAAAGSQTLTFGTAGTGNLTQGGGRGTITFSAPTTGLNATKNIVAVFGETATAAGGIIGPWATIGTAANVQTAYAAYNASGFVVAAAPTAAAVDTDLASSSGNYLIDTGSAFTLAATRTVNAVQFQGAASTLDLATFKLETNGLFFSGSAAQAKTISGTGAGALTTASGGGNLYITTGQVMTAGSEHRIGAPITNNSGTVHLVKSGAGILRLNGVNTFTGNIDINAGTLQIGTNATANGANLGGATGIYAGNIFIAAGANLDFQTDASTTLSGVISGDGNLLKRYIGTLTLGDDNTYTGKTTITAITNAGSMTLVVSSFNSFNGGTPLLANSSLGAPTTLANATIQMGGTQSSPNPTLRYAGAAATGETTDRIINFTFNSSATRTLDASGSGLLKFTSPFTGDNLSTGQLVLTGTGSGEIAGLPFLFNNLTKSGNGTWTLAGPTGSIGLVSVSAGTLVATDPRALGAAIGNLATTGPTISGTATLSLRNNSSVTFGVAGTGYNINNSASGATINVDRVSGTGPNTITVGNLTTTSTSGVWGLNFTGANGASLNAGTLNTPLSTIAAVHTITNNIATTSGASLTLASVFNRAATIASPNLVFAGTGTTIVTGAITQTQTDMDLIKNDAGTLLLNGINTYTGTTSVNAGTLGGTGTIAGAVTVAAAGSIAPGASAGTLSIGGGLDISAQVNGGAGKLKFELGANTATSDQIAVTGTLTTGGLLGFSDFTFTNLAGGPQNVTYTLITTGASAAGTLDATNLSGPIGVGGTGLLSVSGNNILMTVSGITGGGSAYDTWKAANAPVSNPDDDTDGDGVSNAVEFVLGGTSLTKDLDKLPIPDATGSNLTFTFERDQDSIDPKTALFIETSTDLATWSSPLYSVPDVATVGPPVTVTDNLDGTDTIILTVPKSPDTKKFARLKVVITP